jgi:RimJ/RimL family protein N-acetyltransferase
MNVELSGALVVLRPPSVQDIDAINRACQDSETQQFTTVPVPYAREDAVGFLGVCEVGWASGSAAAFAICGQPGGEFDGAIDVRFEPSGSASVGFAVAPWARRQGFATDALRTICRWAFDERGVQRIEWEAVVGNWGSRRAAESVGFKLEGECRKRIVLRGVRHDGWIAGLLPADLG